MLLCETSMLLFVSVWCYAKPRCYYSCFELCSIIPTSMLLFVSVCCYAKPRCYYSCLYVVMRNLDAIIRACMLLCETSMLLFYEAVFISILSCQLSSFFVQNFVQTTSTLCKEGRQLCTKNVNFARTTTT